MVLSRELLQQLHLLWWHSFYGKCKPPWGSSAKKVTFPVLIWRTLDEAGVGTELWGLGKECKSRPSWRKATGMCNNNNNFVLFSMARLAYLRKRDRVAMEWTFGTASSCGGDAAAGTIPRRGPCGDIQWMWLSESDCEMGEGLECSK